MSGNDTDQPVEDPALDDIEANPDELAGDEVEGEYDPDYDVELEVEA